MSKDRILARIKLNKPVRKELPDLRQFLDVKNTQENLEEFLAMSSANGSTVHSIIGQNPTDFFSVFFSEIPKNLHKQYFVTESKLGVAENGCLWLEEAKLPNRKDPFLALTTVFLIHHLNIVPNMLYAYQKLDFDEKGYDVFIAGPSKTADIEQSLVLGAQGAMENIVVVY